MDDEATLEMTLPLDDDGFFRRACPTCEREFKWFNSPEGEGEPVPAGGYFCPYCRVQAPSDQWFTNEQVELAKNRVARDVLGPEFERMARDINRGNRGGLVSITMDYETPEAMDPLVERNDMRRVDFTCHPNEPVKVLEDWTRPVHCLIDSQPAV
jgi:hypothetical protein